MAKGGRIGRKETSRFRRRYLDERRRIEIVRGGWKGLVFGRGEDSLPMLHSWCFDEQVFLHVRWFLFF